MTFFPKRFCHAFAHSGFLGTTHTLYMLLFCEHVFMLGGGSSVGGECYLRYLLFGMIPLGYDV